jgi:hypothetical protein
MVRRQNRGFKCRALAQVGGQAKDEWPKQALETISGNGQLTIILS